MSLVESFADQLLEQAHHLAKREKTKPRQASLRRAVSTAYYALFHLLIAEATSNWKRIEQRNELARAFDHGRMRNASDRLSSRLGSILKKNAEPSSAATIHRNLKAVADTFIESQQQRITADYDNSRRWTRTQALEQIDDVFVAFQRWQSIREEPAAQAYLVSLLGKDR